MSRHATLPATFFKAVAVLFLLAGCVTINVYFPAAAAEKAADRFINDVIGPDAQKGEQPGDQSRLDEWPALAARAVLDFLIAPAHAQADIDMSSPVIQQIKAAMTERHQQLKPFFASGAVGYTTNGLVAVRDQGAISLGERNLVRKLVADENADRERLYREIATANGHPEWEDEIRATYAKRWIAKAPAGWWYQSANGSWVQK